MISVFLALTPLFVGPTSFLLGTVLVLVLLLLATRALFGLAWKIIVIGAAMAGAIWLLGAVSFGPQGLG